MGPLLRIAMASTLVFALTACVGTDSTAPLFDPTGEATDAGRGGAGGTDATARDAGDDATPGDDAGSGVDGADDAPTADGTAGDGGADDAGIASDGDGGSSCGDGVVDDGEECDDGNAESGDGCEADCTTGGLALCAPCESHDECGGPADRCVELAGEHFCGRDCGRADCPSGYVCRAIAEDDVIVARQCRPITGECESACPDADGDEVCDVDDVCAGGDDRIDENDDGVPDACEPIPGDEICDDGIDNDGDEVVDCGDVDCFEAPECEPEPGDEICDDGEDNDDDGAADCDDDDCEDHPGCPRPEVCNNGRDDDLDGQVDCDDDDCLFDRACPRTEVCDNDRDDDFDGRTDCDDADCERSPLCAVPEVCNNGRDDDFDGRTDCDDSDCDRSPLCAVPEVCDNGVDDDLDGRTDCDDGDCALSAACPQPEVCNNGRDDDFDGRTDCDDSDCTGNPLCAVPEVCDNGRDDDFDGRTDCDDSDCSLSPACPQPEVCNNGRDDDFDGRTDCDDSDCAGNPLCAVPEVCDNGSDDDLDGRTDCDDSDCDGHGACARPPGDRCDDPFVAGGYGTWTGSTTTFGADYAASCRTAGGNDVVYRFVAPDSGTMCAHTNGSSYDTVLYVQTACGDSGSDVACDDDGGDGLQSEAEFTASAGTTYFFIVDGFSSGSSGDYSFTIRRGPCDLPAGEVCDETLTANFGTYTGSTASSLHDYSGSCRANTAPDIVYAFTPPSSGSVCIDSFGSDYDTLVYAQTTCGDEDTDVGCDDDTSGLQSQIEIGGVGGQTYYIVVDGYSSASGNYTLNIRDGTCDTGIGDTCSGVEINGFGTFDGTTSGLVDDFHGTCTTANSPDRVYRFRSPVSGTVCADTFGSSYDTVLYVRTSCSDEGSSIACNDDMSSLQSQVEFDVNDGTTYYIVVDGFGSSNSGDYVLNLSNGACP